jgi:hypothetical protein
VITALAPLPAPRWGGAAVWVTGRLSAFHRILVLGGQTGGSGGADALLVDVRDSGATVALPSPVGVIGATVLSIGEGQVVVVGGAAAADVQLLLVEITPSVSLTVTDPAPPPLALERDGPKLVEYARGLILVVGGVSGGATVPLAELIDLRVFPGDVVSTGALPLEVDAPFPVLLEDESVWIFDREGTYGYVPPRGL